MIYNIHHLHCGTMCPACAPLVSQTGLQAHIICHCLLLETDRGLVLIDTGLGLQDYLHTQQRLGRLIHQFGKIEINIQLSAVQQIQQLGLNPKDVQHIFVSHLDFDHAGGISDFPKLPYMCWHPNLMPHNHCPSKIVFVIRTTNLSSIVFGISLNILKEKVGSIWKK